MNNNNSLFFNNNANQRNINYNNNNNNVLINNNNINNNYQNQMNKGEKKEEINKAELLYNLVYMFSYNKGWQIIIQGQDNKPSIVGYFTSLDLYKFLNDQLKLNNLNSFIIRTINAPYIFSGENMSFILHQIIQIIIER